MKAGVLFKFQALLMAVLAVVAWSSSSSAAPSCSQVYNNTATLHTEVSEDQSPEAQAAKEFQEMQVSEMVSGLIEKFDQSLTAPGGMIEAGDQLFSFTSQWLNKSGDVIRSHSEKFSKNKQEQLSNKIDEKTAINNKNLLKLAELVARNKSLKIKILNWIPKYNKRKVEKISQQVRWGAGDIESLLKQLNEENNSYNSLAKEITAEAKKISVAQQVIAQLRDYYQQQVWEMEKSGDTTTDRAMNVKQVLIHLQEELNSLLTLQTVTATLGEAIRAQLVWNNSSQNKAREVLTRTPLAVTGISDRALNLKPEERPEPPVKVNSNEPGKLLARAALTAVHILGAVAIPVGVGIPFFNAIHDIATEQVVKTEKSTQPFYNDYAKQRADEQKKYKYSEADQEDFDARLRANEQRLLKEKQERVEFERQKREYEERYVKNYEDQKRKSKAQGGGFDSDPRKQPKVDTPTPKTPEAYIYINPVTNKINTLP